MSGVEHTQVSMFKTIATMACVRLLCVEFTKMLDWQHADVSIVRLEHALVAVDTDDGAHRLSLVSQNHLGLRRSNSHQSHGTPHS